MEWVTLDGFNHAETLQALAHRMVLALPRLEMLDDLGERPDREECVERRVLIAGFLLQHDAHVRSGVECIPERGNRLLATQGHGGQKMRKHHEVPHRNHRHHIGTQRESRLRGRIGCGGLCHRRGRVRGRRMTAPRTLFRIYWIFSVRLPEPSRLGNVRRSTPSSSLATAVLSSTSLASVKPRETVPR